MYIISIIIITSYQCKYSVLRCTLILGIQRRFQELHANMSDARFCFFMEYGRKGAHCPFTMRPPTMYFLYSTGDNI